VTHEIADLVPLPNRKPLSAEEWAVRLREEPLSDDDRAAFESWIADPAHQAQLAQCRGLGVMASALRARPSAAADLFERVRVMKATRPGARSMRQWRSPALALAAGIAALGITFVLLMPTHHGITGPEVATRHGEQRSLPLEDGTLVLLNTDSVAAYRFTESERLVELKRGEAFFDVRPDHARPFIVRAGKAEVRVVGTQFSVRSTNDRVEVVVREGRVNVTPDTGPLSALMPKVELTRDNRLRLDPSNQLKVTSIDATRAMAWRTGSIAFDDMPLDEVVAEVNRYSEVPLVIEDARLKSHLLSGRVRAGDVDTFLTILKAQFGIEATERSGSIYLTSRAS